MTQSISPPSRPEAPLVQVQGLVKHFPVNKGGLISRRVGAVHAVDGISFDIRRGETLGLVGESGCGKSTTSQLLVRLLDPTAGTIRFEGDAIPRLSGTALQNGSGVARGEGGGYVWIWAGAVSLKRKTRQSQ